MTQIRKLNSRDSRGCEESGQVKYVVCTKCARELWPRTTGLGVWFHAGFTKGIATRSQTTQQAELICADWAA